MGNRESTIHIAIDENPFASKGFMGMILGVDPGDLVTKCEREIISGCKFNVTDLAFYVAALDNIKESLMTCFDEKDKQLLEKIRATSEVITTHINIDGSKKEETSDEG